MLLCFCFITFIILSSVSASKDALQEENTLGNILDELNQIKSKQNNLEELVCQLKIRSNVLPREVDRIMQLLQNGNEAEAADDAPHMNESPSSRNKRYSYNAVAFTVGFRTPELHNLGNGSTIVFDKAITNIGHAYHTNSGIFNAPVNGVYVFTLAMMVSHFHAQYLEIVLDGVVINDIVANESTVDGFVTTTKRWILEVNKGSEVLIRSKTYGVASASLRGKMHTIYSGFLLFETS